MGKLERIIVLIIGIILMSCIFSFNNCYAKVDLSNDIGGFKANIDENTKTNTLDLTIIAGKFLGALRLISVFILVIVLVTSGYSYIVATPDMKEEVKNKMLPMIIGIVLVFSAVSISAFILKAMGG